MCAEHPWHARIYAAYDDGEGVLPRLESLADCEARAVVCYRAQVLPHLARGAPTLLVAHNNVIRCLVKHLSGLSLEAVAAFEVPTGGAVCFRIDQNGDASGPYIELHPASTNGGSA